MLSNLRNFSKTKLSGVLIAIIIVPFVFWGMGSVFSGGNTNNIVKINKDNISTEDFFDFLNKLNINPNDLRNNLDNNIMNEILSEIISLKILNMEIDNLSLKISDDDLSKILTKDKKFLDDNKKFSRLKYEKFLLENNFTAVNYERKVKESKLQKDLFDYVGGGIKSPEFLTKNYYQEDTKQINIEYIDLKNYYEKSFTITELENFISENKERFIKDYINVSYTKITPNIFIDSDEFTSDFFKIIDQIETDISNGVSIKILSEKYNFKITSIKDYYFKKDDKPTLKIIYEKRNDTKINLLDMEDYFLLYEISDLKKRLPNINDKIFYQEVVSSKKNFDKFEFNKDILEKIENNSFNDNDFNDLAKNINNIKKLKIKSKNDNSFLNVDSLKMLYTIPEDDFLLIIDNDQNVYLTKILKFEYNTINKDSDDYKKYFLKSNFKIKNDITSTYDSLLNKNYDIEINQNTLDRVINYFK